MSGPFHFDGGLEGWSIDNDAGNQPGAVNGLWSRTSLCDSQRPGHSPASALAYVDDRNPPVCTYEIGSATRGEVLSPVIDLSGLISAELTLNHFLAANLNPDAGALVEIEVRPVDGSSPTILASSDSRFIGVFSLAQTGGGWQFIRISLDDFVGSSVRIAITFRNNSTIFNSSNSGWYFDDVTICGTTAAPTATPTPTPTPTPAPNASGSWILYD